MNALKLACKHLGRRKTKAILSLAAMVIGIATYAAVSSLTGAMKDDIGKKLDEFGANIIVVPRTNGISLSYGGLALGGVGVDSGELDQASIEQIKTIKNASSINIIAPKLLKVYRLDGRDLILAGIEFSKEFKLKKWWSLNGVKPQAPDEIIVGATVAQDLNLKPGSTLQINKDLFRVTGVLHETGSQEDQFIFMDLGTLQAHYGQRGKLTMLEISAYCNTCPIEDIVKEINQMLHGARATALKQAIELRSQTIDNFARFSMVISAVVLVIASLVVLTTTLASVRERTREIGIYRAIGFRRTFIAGVIISEVLITSLLAGLVGYVAGTFVVRATAPYWIGSTLPLVFRGELLLTSILIATLTGSASGLYPALHAARMDPVEALRAF